MLSTSVSVRGSHRRKDNRSSERLSPVRAATFLCISAAVATAVLPSVSNADTLQDVLRRAIETNPELLSASNRRLATDQELKQSIARYMPSVDFQTAAGYEWSKNPTIGTAATDDNDEDLIRRETELRLTQLIFDGLETPMAIKQTRAAVYAAAYGAQEIAEDVGLRTSQSYLNVLRRQELKALADENLQAHDRTLRQIEARRRQGIGRQADVDQARSRQALSRSNLVVTENNVLDAASAFEVVVGEQPGNLEPPPDLSQFIKPSLEESLVVADDSSPTLQIAAQQVVGSQAQRRGSGSGFYPQVTAEVGRTWNSDIDGRRGSNQDMTALVRLRWNLFRGGADSARVEQTYFLLEEAHNAQSQACRRVREKVQLAWSAFSTLDRQVKVLEEAAQFATDTRRAYQQQFNIGQRTLLDLLDSENEVFTTRTSLAEAQYDYMDASLAMMEATGTLLSNLGVAMPEAARVPDNDGKSMTCDPQALSSGTTSNN